MSAEIHGFCDARFRRLEDAFRANFDDGLELGASLGVLHQGRLVVDLWGGYADLAETRPWQSDTVVLVSSTTKILLALAALMLIDRGLLDPDAPVAQYWPEFAAGGKAAVTVRDAITHQAGIPGTDPPVPFELQHDWAGITARIAAEPHWFDGRRVFCYHASTYGFLIGELIRRVDGRQPAQFCREEITQRVGADFQIGLSSSADVSRVAQVRWQTAEAPAAVNALVMRLAASIGPGDWRSWARLSADIPGANGYTNGRAIAQVCGIAAMRGTLGGVRFLSPRMIELAATEQVIAQDPQFGQIRFGMGFALDGDFFPAPSPACFHWGGYGGSFGLMDPRLALSCGYAPNNFLAERKQDARGARLWRVIGELLPTL